MSEAKTVEFNGKRYTLTRSGWIDNHSYVQVDIHLSRQLDRVAAALYGPAALYDIDDLLNQAKNAQAEDQLVRAEQLVRQALRVNRQHLGAHAMLCSVLRERGLPEQALRETAAMGTSSYPPLRTSRAAAYCDLGEWTQAMQELRPVLAAGGSPQATLILQRIRAEQSTLPRPDRTTPPRAMNAPRPATLASGPPPPRRHEPQPAAAPELKHITIYTAGRCAVDPGPGGYAAILSFGDRRREISGGFRLTTAARMAMMAAIAALRCLKYPCKVSIHSPAQDLADSINRGWARSWRANGWMRDSRVRNSDLWAPLLGLIDQHDLEWIWINHPDAVSEHSRCQDLAHHAIGGHDLAIDQPFEDLLPIDDRSAPA